MNAARSSALIDYAYAPSSSEKLPWGVLYRLSTEMESMDFASCHHEFDPAVVHPLPFSLGLGPIVFSHLDFELLGNSFSRA